MLLSILSLTLFSCSSNKVKELNPTLDQRGEVAGARFGVDENGQAIIQEEKESTKEMYFLILENNNLEDKYASEQSNLQACRDNMADPANGGNGSIVQIPSLEPIKEQAKAVKQEFGLYRERFYSIDKYDLKERLDIERKYNSILADLNRKLISIKLDCERRLRFQVSAKRVNKRLPSDTQED